MTAAHTKDCERRKLMVLKGSLKNSRLESLLINTAVIVYADETKIQIKDLQN